MGLQTALWLLAIPIAYGKEGWREGGREREKSKKKNKGGGEATCKFDVQTPTNRYGKIPFIIIIIIVVVVIK